MFVVLLFFFGVWLSLSVASFGTNVMMDLLNDTFGAAALTRLTKEFPFYLQYLAGQTNGFPTQFGVLKKLLENEKFLIPKIKHMIKDKDMEFEWLMDLANKSFECAFNRQFKSMKNLIAVRKAPLLPFELAGLKNADQLESITLANGNEISLRELRLNGMMTVKGLQRQIVFPSHLLLCYAQSKEKSYENNSLFRMFLREISCLIQIPTTEESFGGIKYEKRLRAMNIIKSYQYPQDTETIDGIRGLRCTLADYLGHVKAESPEEKDKMPTLRIKNENLEKLVKNEFIFPNLTRVDTFTMEKLQSVKKDNLPNRFKPGVMYFPDDSMFPGLDYCFLIYHVDTGEWFLLCIQAKSAVYDIRNWTIKKAEEIVSKIEKILSNVENSFCAVLGIKEATYGWDKKEKKKGCNFSLMHDKSIFAGRECLRQHFGPQYEHVLDWIMTCATSASDEKGKGVSIGSMSRSPTWGGPDSDYGSNDSTDGGNSKNKSKNKSKRKSKNSGSKEKSNEKCFICKKGREPLVNCAMVWDNWVGCDNECCDAWCHIGCFSGEKPQEYVDYILYGRVNCPSCGDNKQQECNSSKSNSDSNSDSNSNKKKEKSSQDFSKGNGCNDGEVTEEDDIDTQVNEKLNKSNESKKWKRLDNKRKFCQDEDGNSGTDENENSNDDFEEPANKRRRRNSGMSKSKDKGKGKGKDKQEKQREDSLVIQDIGM